MFSSVRSILARLLVTYPHAPGKPRLPPSQRVSPQKPCCRSASNSTSAAQFDRFSERVGALDFCLGPDSDDFVVLGRNRHACPNAGVAHFVAAAGPPRTSAGHDLRGVQVES